MSRKSEINSRELSKYTTNEGETVIIIKYYDSHNITIQFEDGTIMDKVNFNNLKNGKVKKPFNRVGERHITNDGENTIITEYFNSKNCTIRFDDGTIYKNINYTSLKNGSIRKNKCRLGRTYTSNRGYTAKIINYIAFNNCTIQFEDGFILENVSHASLRKGSFTNPYYPSVEGIGYLGVGKYVAAIDSKHTPAYNVWTGILERCYSLCKSDKFPTYKGCSISKEWECFQNFAQWYEENHKQHMTGWHLDKDILFKGNKLYSAETCCFVPSAINGVITQRIKIGKYAQGVRKTGNKFSAELTKNGIYTYLGVFNTEDEASEAYKSAKENWIKELAEGWKILIEEDVYKALHNYKL